MDNWDDYINDFIAYLKIEKGLSNNSVDAYWRDVVKLKEFASYSNKTAINLRYQDLVEFVTTLYDLGLNERSQARIISGIKQFFKFLITEGLLTDNPSELLEQPNIGRKLPEVLSLEEIDKIIEAVDLSKFEGERNRAIIETLYSCGLRVSELINLRFEDLYFNERFIRVIGKGNKERLVPVSDSVEWEITNYKTNSRKQINTDVSKKIVFLNRRGNPLTRNMIFIIVQQLAQSAGILKKISPHTFRHSFATHLLNGGANLRAIQEMLGHESITTTEIYTHLDERFLREAILKYHPRNKKRSFSLK